MHNSSTIQRKKEKERKKTFSQCILYQLFIRVSVYIVLFSVLLLWPMLLDMEMAEIVAVAVHCRMAGSVGISKQTKRTFR